MRPASPWGACRKSDRAERRRPQEANSLPCYLERLLRIGMGPSWKSVRPLRLSSETNYQEIEQSVLNQIQECNVQQRWSCTNNESTVRVEQYSQSAAGPITHLNMDARRLSYGTVRLQLIY